MTTGAVNPRRADTRRNHERILAAALESLTTSGEVSFNAIAKKAEVGVGTVYRHFPTPEALILAVYRREVKHLLEVVPVLLRTNTPEQAFREWTGHLARYMMTKRGLADALRTATTSQEELFAKAYEVMVTAVSTLLEANVRAGSVRADVDPPTLLRALSGLLYLNPREDWQNQTEDLTDLLWKGMCADHGGCREARDSASRCLTTRRSRSPGAGAAGVRVAVPGRCRGASRGRGRCRRDPVA
jgi:AcrR family transcriptional regulator